MSNKNKYKKQNKQQKRRIEIAPYIGMIPVIFTMGFIPLFMRLMEYDAGLSGFDWFPDGAEHQTDVFLMIKSGWLIGTAVVCLITLLLKWYVDRKLKFDWALVFLGVFALFVLLSGIFSPYKWLVFGAGFERFEGVFVVLSYAVICWYAFEMTETWQQIRFAAVIIGIGLLIETLIGISQGTYNDFFNTEFGKKCITPMEAWDNLDSISVVMTPGEAYGTLYNPDFCGLYFAMFIPILAGLIFAFKKIWAKIICIVLLAMSVRMLFMSWSNSGQIGMLVALIPLTAVLCWRKKKAFIAWCGVMGSLVVVGIGVWFGSATVREKVSSVLDNGDIYMGRARVDKIITGDEDVTFYLKDGNEIHLSWEVMDSQMLMSITDQDGNHYDSYPGFAAEPLVDENGSYFVNAYYDNWWYFIKEDDGYYFINAAGNHVKIRQDIEKANVFTDSFAHFRGLIWNNCFPILKNCMIIGSGADSFIAVYPQDDYLVRAYHNGTRSPIFDVKPHSWFLQVWMENGFIAFVAQLLLFFWYFISFFRVYRKVDFKDPLSFAGLGIFIGFSSSIVVMLANDSNVCTSPVFWTALGFGLAVNRALKMKYAPVEQKLKKK